MAEARSLPATWGLRIASLGRADLRKGLGGGQWVLGSQVLTSAANLATTVLLLRGIGLEAFGQFSLGFLLLMVVRSFFHGAILAPTSTLAPRLKPTSIAAFRGVLLAVTAGFAAVSSAILGVLCLLLAPLLQAEWLLPMALPLMVANFAACGADMVSRYHLAYARAQRTFVIELARYTVQIGALVALITIGSATLTPNKALYVLALGSIAAIIVGSVGYASVKISRPLFRVLWPRYWNFVRWMSMANLFETVQTLAPMLIGLAILGEAALGMLRTVAQLANTLNLTTNALQQILPITATRQYQTSGTIGLQRLLASVVGMVLVYFILVGGLLLALSPWIATYLFQSAPPMFYAVLVWFVAANLFISIRQVASTVFIVREKPSHVFLIQGVSSVFAVVLPLFASSYSAVAIPIAVAASTGVGMLICLWRVRQELSHG